MSANDMLIKNLEKQLERLVEQLKDLEEVKNEIDPSEFSLIKEETIEQIQEFSQTLERMNKGDVSLNNKLSVIKKSIRTAIASSFNTLEMIKMFGAQDLSELEKQLMHIDEDFRLKKITKGDMEFKKNEILTKLKEEGHNLSTDDINFMEKQNMNYLQQMEKISDD